MRQRRELAREKRKRHTEREEPGDQQAAVACWRGERASMGGSRVNLKAELFGLGTQERCKRADGPPEVHAELDSIASKKKKTGYFLLDRGRRKPSLAVNPVNLQAGRV